MTQNVYITGSDIPAPPPATVEVSNFPNPQNVAGAITVSNFVDLITASLTTPLLTNISDPISITGNVSIENSSVAGQYSTFGNTQLVDNGPGAINVIGLPGYNTVTPTIEVGQMTALNLNAQPVLLMLWNSTANKWQAAQCDNSGKLMVSL